VSGVVHNVQVAKVCNLEDNEDKEGVSGGSDNVMQVKNGDLIVVISHNPRYSQRCSSLYETIDACGLEPSWWLAGQKVDTFGCLERVKLVAANSVTIQQPSEEMSLRHLLQIPMGIIYLTRQLIKEYSIENLAFWLEVRKFRSSNTEKEEMVSHARAIVAQFVDQTADQQANLEDKVRSQICGIVVEGKGEITPALFDKAHQQVFKLIDRDSFKRFATSELFREFLADSAEAVMQTEKQEQRPSKGRTQLKNLSGLFN
jgi:hypothetical protein